MAAPAASGILALLRALGIGAEAASPAAGAATGMTRAQQIARAATAERQAGRTAAQQRMEAMANRGAGTSAAAPVGAPNAMSPVGSTIVGGAALPMAASPSSFFPLRAEGDPAGAMNRRNAPTDYGMSDAEYREADKPSLFEETNIGAPRFTPEPASDPGREDYNALFQSLMRAPQRSGPTSTGSIAPPAAAPSPMGGLFSGPDYQSNNQAVVSRPQGPMPGTGGQQRATLNFGDSENAADFFRADKAMQGLLRDKEEFVGMASGGAANGSSNKAAGSGRDAAIYKALEIIHHMMVNRR